MRHTFHWVIIVTLGVIVSACQVSTTQNPPNYNVKDYGAIADTQHLSTESIQSAIDDCAENGGGTVHFPAGNYLTAPLELKSDVTIHLSAGCTIYATQDFHKYPIVKTRWEGTNCKGFMPLFYAYKDTNIAITGQGKINGQGSKWWKRSYEIEEKTEGNPRPITELTKKIAEYNEDCPDLDDSRTHWRTQFLRPPLVQFYACKDVLMRDVHLTKPAFWTIHPVYCENVTIDNVTVVNPSHSANTDGCNPESSKNVHISNCHFDVGDDCIAIKSGIDQQGRKIGIPSENITITNCTMIHGHGGIVIGSEMSGGIKNITVSNCVLQNTTRGIRVKTARGRGGTIQNFRASDIIMEDIKNRAIVLNTNYQNSEKPQPVTEKTPILQKFHFSNISVENVTGNLLVIQGLEEMPVQDITLRNVWATADDKILINHAKNITLENVQLTVLKADEKYDINHSGEIIINGRNY